MHYDEKVLQVLAGVSAHPWDGFVFRHMFANFSPDHENTSGARWNYPEVPAIYSSLRRDVVLAEAEYQISMQPLRPKARRTVYRIAIMLGSVLDISDNSVLTALGLPPQTPEQWAINDCQLVGSSVERLGHDGLLVPSARGQGKNLVIYPNKAGPNYKFTIMDAEVVDAGASW